MKLLSAILLAGILLSGCQKATTPDSTFARIVDGQFIVDGKPYYYIGTNFWYAPILASQGAGGDRQRLHRELDSLAACGIDNLRILVGADGAEGVQSKIEPTLQRAPGDYNDSLLDGLDYLMQQLGARGMKAVLYLNNSWEWSGGYTQYQMWGGDAQAPIPAVDGWQAYMTYAQGFLRNAKAQQLFADHVRFIVSRTNRYTHTRYVDDPAIFSWQIGNEPRAFCDENKPSLAAWIGQTAQLIRSLDPNHLISTGSEGLWGCENDAELTQEIHAFPEISYLNLHIWPYNWGWVSAEPTAEELEHAKQESDHYIARHLEIAKQLQKPVVIEEFGFPRDGFRFERNSPTTLRDGYYEYLFAQIADSKRENGLLAGCNCWAWGGAAQPAHLYWQRGDDYCGDPAQEQQGLNSVFNDDTTVGIIRAANQQINPKTK